MSPTPTPLSNSALANQSPGNAASGAGPRLSVTRPGTGEPLGSYPIATAEDVAAAVERARGAADWWAGLTFAQRGKRLDAFRGILARRFAQISKLVSEETGKPVADAAIEVATILDHIAWAARHARSVLGPRRTRSTLMSFHLSGSIEYRPLGVVGVIGPWNFPVMTPLGSIVFALAAGNAVVFKPSELTPGVGLWLGRYMAEAVPEAPVLQVLTGDGTTGDALARADIDKIAFTGSTATAKKVMAAAAERLTPMVAECGGKDAFVVDYDADLDAAAEAAAWTALSNAGQTCVGTERIYVHESVSEAFGAKLAAIVGGLRAGADDAAPIGPMTMAGQVDVVEDHLRGAVDAGARVLAGGVGAPEGQVVQPSILTGVADDAPANTEETFGPTANLMGFSEVGPLLARINATGYGLGGTVYGRARAAQIARGMRTGMVSINAALGFAMLPSVPFGGVGKSGFGRIHGPDGLREFAYAHSAVRRRLPPVLDPTTFARTAKQDELLATVVNLLHGGA